MRFRRSGSKRTSKPSSFLVSRAICLTKVVKPQDMLETAALIEALEKKHGLEIGNVRILAAVESARGLDERADHCRLRIPA